jgi:hypothetical protein
MFNCWLFVFSHKSSSRGGFNSVFKVVGSIFKNHLFAIIGYSAWSIRSDNQFQHNHFETLKIKNVISLVF